MSVRWTRLAGDTAVFAVEISFVQDPDDGAAQDPDVAASWGKLKLWVGGRNLASHSVGGELSDGVTWYLLPLLEWLAENWEPLLHEERLPVRNEADCAATSLQETAPPYERTTAETAQWELAWDAWWRRHSLQAAREGGLFPEIILRRLRDRIEASWGTAPPAGSRPGFVFPVTDGYARFPVEYLARPLFQVAREAAAYLATLRPDSERVSALGQALDGLRDGAQVLDRRLAW